MDFIPEYIKTIFYIVGFIFYNVASVVLFCLTWPIQLTYLLFKLVNYKSFMEKKRLMDVLKRKQAERKLLLSNMKEIFGNGTTDHRNITSLSVESLISKLQSRKLSALEVTLTYIAKALEDTEKFNSVTDFIPDAVTLAKSLDEMPTIMGPLHGVPMCVKDDTDVEGVDSTLGYVKNLYKPAKSSANIVNALKELGAVPIAKTNVPQGVLCNGSSNPIFGQTLNPLRSGMTPGGSSSGTASLIASGGAVFGTGSCFGRSLAVPAHFCGIASLKPTFGRLSSSRINKCIPCPSGQYVPGLMAKKSSTLVLVFKSLVKSKSRANRDPTCPLVRWKESSFASKEKLRIGYFTTLPIFPAFDDTRNTVLRAKRALETKGHTFFPFEMPDCFHFTKLKADLTFADEGKHFMKMLDHEDISADFYPLWRQFRLPKWYRFLKTYFYQYVWMPQSLKSRRRVSQMAGNVKSADLWNTMQQIEALRDEILNKMETYKLDLILSPVAAYPALTFEANQKTSGFEAYTALWSLANMPTGVTQFGYETGSVDTYDVEGDKQLSTAKEALQYSIGMPIGVQIIGKPFQEETVLRLMCELDLISQY